MTKQEYEHGLYVQRMLANEGSIKEHAMLIMQHATELITATPANEQDCEELLYDIIQAAECLMRENCVDTSEWNVHEYIDEVHKELGIQ